MERGSRGPLIPAIHLVREPLRDAKQGTPRWTAINLSWWPGEEQDGTVTHVGRKERSLRSIGKGVKY